MATALGERPFYTRVALLGLLMFLCAAALLLIALLIYDPAEVVVILSLVVPALVVVAAIAFIRPWGLALGVLGAGPALPH